MPSRNFIMLIGGPGKFFACDPVHDKNWSNYLQPMQIAVLQNLCKLDDEKLHWVVFAPAYRNRWRDDREIKGSIDKQKIGRLDKTRIAELNRTPRTWLETERKGHATRTEQKIASEQTKTGVGSSLHASDGPYLNRISQFCNQHGITLELIEQPAQFWHYLFRQPVRSISRVWYCGHAASSGLSLGLGHSSACAAMLSNQVTTAEVSKLAEAVRPRINLTAGKTCQFFGCGTHDFASAWCKAFGQTAGGASNSITFEAIHGGDPNLNVLERLKTMPAGGKSPNWTDALPPHYEVRNQPNRMELSELATKLVKKQITPKLEVRAGSAMPWTKLADVPYLKWYVKDFK